MKSFFVLLMVISLCTPQSIFAQQSDFSKKTEENKTAMKLSSPILLHTLSPVDLWWRFFTNSYSWDKQNNGAFCNKAFEFCITNKPKWHVDFPQRFWNPKQVLVRFAVLKQGTKERTLDLEAGVGVSPPDLLKGKKYDTETSFEYLMTFLQKQKPKWKKFKLIQEPTPITIGGKESARARYELINSKGELLESEIYVLIHGNFSYMVIYFAKKEVFEQYYSPAMQIIESFKFTSEPVTQG